MNKYEKIYTKAKSRANGSNASWLDAAIAPLAEDIEERTGTKTTISGPFGLRAEVLLKNGERYLTITPNFDGGELTLYYDTGETNGRYAPETLGGCNGFDNVQARLPETLDEIVSLFGGEKPQETMLEKREKQLRELLSRYIDSLPTWNDAEIIDNLVEIFSREELEYFGYGNFIKNYFEEDTDDE